MRVWMIGTITIIRSVIVSRRSWRNSLRTRARRRVIVPPSGRHGRAGRRGAPGERYEYVLEGRLGGLRRAEPREEPCRRAGLAHAGDSPQAPAEEIGVLEARVAPHGRERRERLGRERHLEEPAGERALQLGRAARGDQFPVEDEGEAVALFGLVHVVRRDEDRHPARGGELVDEVPEEAAALRVDASGRFVEEEELGLVEQGRRERDALPLAGREVLGQLAEDRLEAQACRERADALGEARARKAVYGTEKAQVFLDGEVDVER